MVAILVNPENISGENDKQPSASPTDAITKKR